MDRRSFLAGLGVAAALRPVFAAPAAGPATAPAGAAALPDIAAFDRPRVLRAAARYLGVSPSTVTSAHSARSAGGLHDFFSEGDYWWPDPNNPDGPYVQRDGMTNPDNFVEHRKALMRLSVQMPALTAAWKLSGEQKYAEHAAAHVRAWFVTEATRMNPDLQYAQAIHGRFTGRGTGIIDTIHLVEVARALPLLVQAKALSSADFAAVTRWFADYTAWMTTHKYGTDERDAKNNHGTCWLMQVAAFATLTGDAQRLDWCAERFKTVIIPGQIAPDGSQPLELRRTKPYGYSLFNLEALATTCHMLSERGENLWAFTTADGRGVAKAIEYMVPFIRDKSTWKQPPDVMYFEQWPMRQEALLFGALAYKRDEYLELWKRLPADSDVDEVTRNYFIRQPVLWVA